LILLKRRPAQQGAPPVRPQSGHHDELFRMDTSGTLLT
jgi:hypothetical protein